MCVKFRWLEAANIIVSLQYSSQMFFPVATITANNILLQIIEKSCELFFLDSSKIINNCLIQSLKKLIIIVVVLIFTSVKKLKPCDSNVSPYINILLIYSSI